MGSVLFLFLIKNATKGWGRSGFILGPPTEPPRVLVAPSRSEEWA